MDVEAEVVLDLVAICVSDPDMIGNPLQRGHVEAINSSCGVYTYTGGVGSNANDTSLGT